MFESVPAFLFLTLSHLPAVAIEWIAMIGETQMSIVKVTIPAAGKRSPDQSIVALIMQLDSIHIHLLPACQSQSTGGHVHGHHIKMQPLQAASDQCSLSMRKPWPILAVH